MVNAHCTRPQRWRLVHSLTDLLRSRFKQDLSVKEEVVMKIPRLHKEPKSIRQRPPKLIYNPAQQFKHRDRGTQSGRVKTS